MKTYKLIQLYPIVKELNKFFTGETKQEANEKAEQYITEKNIIVAYLKEI